MFWYVLQPLMVDTLPNPFGEEIKGIATVSGVPLGKKTQLLSTRHLQVAAVCKKIRYPVSLCLFFFFFFIEIYIIFII